MGDWLSNIVNLLGLGYEVFKDQHLTGAQREANQFNAEQAGITRDFSAQQAEIGRDWQENQYLKYNSPQALVSQYQNAGINPALMFGGSTPAASTSAPTATGVSASSVNPSGGNVVGMIGELLKLSMLGEQKRALQLQNEGQEIDNALKDAYGAMRADAEIRQIDQAIQESIAKTGEASTRSALNSAMADLTRTQNDNEKFMQTEKEWRSKFITDYHMTPELAGDLVKAAATLVGAGIVGASKIIERFARPKGTHTRSITERQADGTTITDVFSGFPDL